jgi:hypothetical protein
MKASTVRALRLPMLILLAFGLLAAAVFIISGRMSGQDHPSGGQTMFHLESAIGRDLVNASGQHFVVDDLFVAGDKLDLRYHAIGVAPMLPGQPPPPQCWNQPPALANVASDGNVYVPYDGSTGGQEGNPIIHGEFIWRFRGTPPHHLAISVVQLNCDTNANWTIHVDN